MRLGAFGLARGRTGWQTSVRCLTLKWAGESFFAITRLSLEGTARPVRLCSSAKLTMSAARNLPMLTRDSYRAADPADDLRARAQAHLERASDALSMALLALAGEGDDDRGDKWRRAEQARGLLAEAVTALSRARVYRPGIRTHALPVLLDSASTPGHEIRRLYGIANRLLWQNHRHLPARIQAEPLPPEEEAQLAVVLAGLARHNRMGRAFRSRWTGLALGVAVSAAMLGLPVVGAAAGVTALGIAGWRLARDRAGALEN